VTNAAGRFAHVTRLTERGEGEFAGELSPAWTIGDKPNGGYLLAILGRAATLAGAHRHVIAASAHYVRPPEPGPVDVETLVLRAGRSASQVRTRLVQDRALRAEALVTTADLDPGSAPYWSAGLPAISDVPYDACMRLPSPPSGTPVALMDEIELRLEPDSLGFLTGSPKGRGELRGWLSLLDGEPFDPISLLFAVDAFPPGTFDIELAGWVPTLELTVYVRALPRPGPVHVLQRAQLIDARRVDEACFIWDSGGRLVAQSTQLAGIRLG